jgi:hypothetical protein
MAIDIAWQLIQAYGKLMRIALSKVKKYSPTLSRPGLAGVP